MLDLGLVADRPLIQRAKRTPRMKTEGGNEKGRAKVTACVW